MIRTYRYPLYPTRKQETVLLAWLEFCRQLYNAGLEHRIGAWKAARVSVNYNDQAAELVAIRAVDGDAAAVPSDTARSILRRLDRAFKAFFRRHKTGGAAPGFPRFRSQRRFDSFGIGRVGCENNRVRVPRLGMVRFHAYRPLGGVIRNATIRRREVREERHRAYQDWPACLSYDVLRRIWDNPDDARYDNYYEEIRRASTGSGALLDPR